LGHGAWAQTPNPQSPIPIPNPQNDNNNIKQNNIKLLIYINLLNKLILIEF